MIEGETMGPKKIIGIVGTRRRDDLAADTKVRKAFLSIYNYGDEIVSGGCTKGADRFAEDYARQYQVPIKIYYAPWNKVGKGAGFARNDLIAQDADVLIACVSSDRSGGTEDTIRKFQEMGKTALILV
jgi:hypothetical protein